MTQKLGKGLFGSGIPAAGLFFLTACAGSLFSSCSKEEVSSGAQDLRITVQASVAAPTKATDNAFEAGDAIGLSVVKWLDGAEQNLSGTRLEDNVKFTNTAGTFVSDAVPYFADATSKNTFYAYYPYNDNGFDANASTLGVAVQTDQTGAGLSKSDYMAAVTRNVVPNGKPVALDFKHVLSKITIELKAGRGITLDELKTASVTLKNFRTRGMYDMDAKTFSDLSEKTDILPNGALVRNGEMLTGLSAIVVPQQRRGGESVFYVVYDNTTMAYKPSSDFTFESTREHVFTATVSLTPQGPALEVGSEIFDWETGKTIAGNAELPASPVTETVKDIEGNEYPVVEIAGLKWMGANLKSTKFNDGSPIEKKEGGNMAWSGLTTPAYCALNNADENLAKYGPLYTHYVVAAGNICPDGWRLPTAEEFRLLLPVVYKSPADLLADDGSWDASLKATNKTGFAALPGGVSYDFAFYDDEANFWSSTVDPSEQYPNIYLSLSEYASSVTGHLNYPGMSIRCVKE